MSSTKRAASGGRYNDHAKKIKTENGSSSNTIPHKKKIKPRDDSSSNTIPREKKVKTRNGSSLNIVLGEMEVLLWKRCDKFFSVSPYKLLDGLEVEANGIGWSYNFCYILADLICCPIFWKDIPLLRVAIRTSICMRLDEVEFSKNRDANAWLLERSRCADDNNLPALETPRHISFLQFIGTATRTQNASGGTTKVDESTTKVLASDIKAVINAWDLYIDSTSMLNTEMKSIDTYITTAKETAKYNLTKDDIKVRKRKLLEARTTRAKGESQMWQRTKYFLMTWKNRQLYLDSSHRRLQLPLPRHQHQHWLPFKHL